MQFLVFVEEISHANISSTPLIIAEQPTSRTLIQYLTPNNFKISSQSSAITISNTMPKIIDECSFAGIPMEETWQPAILADDLSFSQETPYLSAKTFDDFVMFDEVLEETGPSTTQSFYDSFDLVPSELPPIVSPDVWGDEFIHTAIAPNCYDMQREYNEALSKLADSMRRSDFSRKQIIIQRQMIDSTQEFSENSRSRVWSFIKSHANTRFNLDVVSH